MKRGTTPTYVIEFNLLENASVDQIKSICLAFKQTSSGAELYKHIPEDGGEIASDGAYITLTQAETRLFNKGRLQRQVMVTFKDGTVIDELPEKEQVFDVLHEVDH